MKLRKVLWFIAGAAIGTTATVLTRRALELSGGDVRELGKDIYERGRKIVEDATKHLERSGGL